MKYYNILWLTISLLAVIANSLCLSAIRVGRMRLNARYKLILNLLVVDLAMSIQLSGGQLALEFYPHDCLLGLVSCKILFYNLLFTLLLIACQHYVLIVYPLRSTTWLRHTGKAILVSWLLAPLPDIASIIYSITQNHESFCESMWYYTFYIRRYVYLAVVGVCTVVFLVVYIRVYLASRRISDHPYTSPGAELQHQQQQQRLRYKVNTSLLILATFLLGYLPPSIDLCLFLGGIYVPEWYQILTATLFHCNNLCDPLIYAVRTKKFKTAFRKMFCRHHPGDLHGSPDIELREIR